MDERDLVGIIEELVDCRVHVISTWDGRLLTKSLIEVATEMAVMNKKKTVADAYWELIEWGFRPIPEGESIPLYRIGGFFVIPLGITEDVLELWDSIK